MASVVVSVMEPLSSGAPPPRQVIRRGNVGSTLGRPGEPAEQRHTLVTMLELLDSAGAPGTVERL